MHLLVRTLLVLQVWVHTISISSSIFVQSCQQFEADCEGCLANGCVWCPGDATCSDSAAFTFDNKLHSCLLPEDFETSTCVQPGNVFSDPMYSGQSWVYDMINVEAVWQRGVLGTGVRVRVNDNGVEASHPEFLGRFDVLASCETYEPVSVERDGSNVPLSHGTTVAAILGAGANNGECSVGIAPEVTISSCSTLYGDGFLAEKLDQFDISQNSFGVAGCKKSPANVRDRTRRLQEQCPFTFENNFDLSKPSPCSVCDFSSIDSTCESAIIAHCETNYEEDVRACSGFLDLILGGNCDYNVLGDEQREDVIRGIMEGRGGKGIVYIFSSGDSFQEGDDTNISMYTNSRFFITVGAVGKDSSHASYSTPGASLFVTAPGGDVENVSNHVTVGMDGSCQDAGEGTSFSCPVVSGVVALMLQVNPNLTWRDVQHILAKTSQPVVDSDDETSIRNAASYWHSNLYGFGIVNADAAVRAAEKWVNVESEQILVTDSGAINLGIGDDPTTPAVSMLAVQSSINNFVLESIEVELDLRHSSRGHLEIVLTSPSGTKSTLHPGNRPENGGQNMTERWKLLTVRNWGEDPNGEWTLSLVDLKEGDVDTDSISLVDELSSWRMVMYGRASTSPFVGGLLPTLAPTMSIKPSTQPSSSPSRQPTNEPSSSPSLRPSASPSVQPSTLPSVQPSALPSVQPSTMPSVQPSSEPSMFPTLTPLAGSREVSLNYPGVTVTFEGISMLTENALEVFAEATEAFYKEQYDLIQYSSRRRLDVIEIRNFDTSINVTKQSLGILDGNTITYDQSVFLVTNEKIDTTVASAILVDPLMDPGTMEQYMQQLREASEEFKILTNIFPPRVSYVEGDLSKSRSAGAKWGISIGVLLIFFGCGAVIYKTRVKRNSLKDSPVPSVDIPDTNIDTVSYLQDRESEFDNSVFDMEDALHRSNRDGEVISQLNSVLDSQAESVYNESELGRVSDHHTLTDGSSILVPLESDAGTSVFEDTSVLEDSSAFTSAFTSAFGETDEDESLCTVLKEIKELKGSNEAKYFEICKMHERLQDLRSAEWQQKERSYLYDHTID